MRVLVTGGAGYIGSHAAKALAQAGHEPVVFDNLAKGRREAVKWGPLVNADLAHRNDLRNSIVAHRIEAIMHFAASIEVGESMANPRPFFWNNVVGTLNVLDAMLETGLRFIIFSSSAAVYGNPERIPIPESHPLRPVNVYGETKFVMERALFWYGDAYGIKWAALRYFNAAGADLDGEIGEDHHPESHLIPLVLQAALGRRPQAEVFGTDYSTPDGTAIRDFIHVVDLADAHLRALEYLAQGGESIVLNLGTGKGHSVREVISAVEEIADRPVPCRDSERRAGDPPVLVADPSLAAKVLQWRPQRSDLKTIIETAWAWHTRGGFSNRS